MNAAAVLKCAQFILNHVAIKQGDVIGNRPLGPARILDHHQFRPIGMPRPGGNNLFGTLHGAPADDMKAARPVFFHPGQLAVLRREPEQSRRQAKAGKNALRVVRLHQHVVDAPKDAEIAGRKPFLVGYDEMLARRPQPTPMHTLNMDDTVGGGATFEYIQPSPFTRSGGRGIDAYGGQCVTQYPNVLVEPKSIHSGNNEIFHDLLMA